MLFVDGTAPAPALAQNTTPAPKNDTVSVPSSPAPPNSTAITEIIQSNIEPVFLIVEEDFEWSIGENLSDEQLEQIDSVVFEPQKFGEFLTFDQSSLSFSVDGSSLTNKYELENVMVSIKSTFVSGQETTIFQYVGVLPTDIVEELEETTDETVDESQEADESSAT